MRQPGSCSAKANLLSDTFLLFVHLFFIAFGVELSGAVTFAYAGELLRPAVLSRALLASAFTFWFSRLIAQFTGYDSAIWKGDRLRRLMHVVFALLWTYVTTVYAYALLSVFKLER